MNVNPGNLNKKIIIMERVETVNPAGYKSSTLSSVRECWSSVNRISGTELVKNGAELSDAKVRFLIRWSSAEITRKMIVRYAGDDYEILYVNDYNDAHEYIELMCARTTTEA